MIKKITKFSMVLLLGSMATTAHARVSTYQPDAADRYAYVGIYGGITLPVVDNFKYTPKGEKKATVFHIKGTSSFGAKFGYSFYPSMGMELSISHHPKYKLSYVIPEKNITIPSPLGEIPLLRKKLEGTTKVSADLAMLSIKYDWPTAQQQFRPYVIFGAGIARVSINNTSSYTDSFAGLGFANLEVFRLTKHKMNCFAWQAGVGLQKDLTNNLSLDLSAKLQVVNNIKLKYSTLNPVQQKFVAQTPVKKTLGVGEITLGLNFKFPSR